MERDRIRISSLENHPLEQSRDGELRDAQRTLTRRQCISIPVIGEMLARERVKLLLLSLFQKKKTGRPEKVARFRVFRMQNFRSEPEPKAQVIDELAIGNRRTGGRVLVEEELVLH